MNDNTKIITLTRRSGETHECLVDASDFDWIVNFGRWRLVNTGERLFYAVTGGVNSPLVAMHRLITGAKNGQYVDHADSNGLNNRRGNLRICNQSQNQANQNKVRGSVPYKGVCQRTYGRRYSARIMHGGKEFHLGRFDKAEDAARAYDIKAIELFGPFARTNEALGLLPTKAA